MINHLCREVREWTTKRLVAGMLLLFLLGLGNGTIASASETHSLLQFKNDRVTGVLRQVSLREVFEQLQENLEIEYSVPGEELDVLISATLTKEPVLSALSKILAPWDYALQVDLQGRVRHVFVVAKTMDQNEVEEDEPKKSQESQMASTVDKMKDGERNPKIFNRTPPGLGTEVSSNSSGMVYQSSGESTKAFPFVEPSELRPMDILPPQGGPMIIQPSSSTMEVIPASGYPPMDILSVSEDAQREFLEEFRNQN